MATLEKLEQRIQQLEKWSDVEAIKQMKAKYLTSIDLCKFEDALDTFSRTAVADYGDMGVFKGEEEIKGFLYGIPNISSFNIHHGHNPIIEITGPNTAKGMWELQSMTHSNATDKAMWIMGYYEDEYIKEDGEWKHQKLRFTWQSVSEYEQGWAKQRFAPTL